MAGWAPELWAPEDLLNRTDAFVASGDAEDEVFRARLVAAVGASRAHAILEPEARASAPRGLDFEVVSLVVGDAVRRAGTAPFFMALAGPASVPRGSNAWAVSAARSETHAPLLAADPHGPLDNPSLRYIVHLDGERCPNTAPLSVRPWRWFEKGRKTKLRQTKIPLPQLGT